jgi:HSP20 family protein
MAEEKSRQKQTKNEVAKQGNGNQRALTHPRSRSMATPYFASLGRLRSEFDRLFDDFFHGWPVPGGGERERNWELDIQDDDNEVIVRAEAPGFEPNEFDVELRGDNLVLSARHSEEASEDDAGYRWQKRELYHSVPLPTEVDPDKIDAEYHNGILQVRLPKSEPAKSRKIQIKG